MLCFIQQFFFVCQFDRLENLADLLAQLIATPLLDALAPDASFLCESLAEFAAVLSADITSRWQLRTLPLCQTLDQLAEGAGFAGCSPLARLVLQAQTYVQWQTLRNSQQISEQETSNWFAAVQLSSDSVDILARTNLKRLNIEL